jgi:hypothetical protein
MHRVAQFACGWSTSMGKKSSCSSRRCVGHLRRQLRGVKAPQLLCGVDYHIAETGSELKKKPCRPQAQQATALGDGHVFVERFFLSAFPQHRFISFHTHVWGCESVLHYAGGEALSLDDVTTSRRAEAVTKATTAQTFRIAEITFSLE